MDGWRQWPVSPAGPEEVDRNPGGPVMSQAHHVKSREIGMIRVYLKPGERRPTRGLKARLTG
jgi:hypothetical protein